MSDSPALKKSLNLIKPYKVPEWASAIKCAPTEYVDVSKEQSFSVLLNP